MDTLITNEAILNMLNHLNEGVYLVDVNRQIKFWNKAAENITGYSKKDVEGFFCYNNILQHIDSNGNQLCLNGCPLQATMKDQKERTTKVYLHHKDGYRVAVNVQTIPIVHDGSVIGAIETFSDFSSEDTIEENIKELKTIAFHDPLTKLFNRRYMQLYLENKLKEFDNFKVPFGLLFFDIDHFKNVNDTYGHNVGDDILAMVSKSAQSALRKSDIISRWGGEEFIVLLQGVDYDDLLAAGEKLRKIIQHSNIKVNEELLSVTISIGATLARGRDSSEDIISRADKLMYESKKMDETKSLLIQLDKGRDLI